jgi:hypothetical protein
MEYAIHHSPQVDQANSAISDQTVRSYCRAMLMKVQYLEMRTAFLLDLGATSVQ